MKKLFDWFSTNGLYVLALFLLAFIPLYPKLPLIDIVQTWVSIRLEDFFVAFACLILAGIKIRERKGIQTPLNIPFLIYFVVAGISLLNALIFIRPSIPTQLLPHLAVLHFLRRFEYISVFFLAFEAFRKKPNLMGVIAVLSGTYILVLLYGVGQKFFGFPAFLTMNEEFAKGIPLRLPSTARIPSTFGGHYDLGAYLVFTIPIMGSLVFGVKQWFLKVLYGILWLGGLIVLLFTASRISFGVYIVAIAIMLWWQKKPILILPVILLSVFILNLTSGASERFYKTFRVSNVIVDLSTGKPIGTLDKLEGGSATLEQGESPAEESLPKGSEFINLPSGTSEQTESEKEGRVIKKIEYFTSAKLTTGSGEMATISGSFLVQKALVYDISITTRLQGQWPRAMEAFKRNILLGSGLSSLSLAADGDYHRMLGETGILGTVAFLGILVVAYVVFFKTRDKQHPLGRSLAIGVFAGLSGLLCNAVLIDVFEASKVAFTLWLTLGFTISLLVLQQHVQIDYFKLLRAIFTHPFAYMVYLIIAVFAVWGGALSLYFLGDDFTWTRWAAQSSLSDILGYFTSAQGFFYRPIPKLWYFLLFSIFWLKPFMYHCMSLILVSVGSILLYLFLLEYGLKRLLAWFMTFLFIALSIHHENIFWISGQSSLLSSVFLIGALYSFQKTWKMITRIPKIMTVVGWLCVFLSMLSYDGMLLVPFCIAILAAGVYKQGKKIWLILILIPLYWWARIASGAVIPSGDYGYKWTTFLVNSIGNGFGYGLGLVIGPSALEYITVVRTVLKAYLPYVTGLAILGLVGVGYGITRLRSTFARFMDSVLFLFAAVLSGVSYLGLGNASERYAYIPSIFIIIALAIGFFKLWNRKNLAIQFAVIVGIFIVSWWNIREVKRIEGDWKMASKVAESSLLSIRTEIYPPKKDDLVFFFVNLPIRYGRAWIFPTGTSDALWHMFRDNIYKVYTASTIQEAYEFKTDRGTRYVYIFEDYVLKKGIQQTTEIIENP